MAYLIWQQTMLMFRGLVSTDLKQATLCFLKKSHLNRFPNSSVFECNDTASTEFHRQTQVTY